MKLKRLHRADLSKDSLSQLSKQEYTAKKSIEGVVVQTLSVFPDESGAFVEIGRTDSKGVFGGFPGFIPLQVSWSALHQGLVKGAHLHLNQEDVWFIPPNSRMMVGLKDMRRGSRTEGSVQKLILGAGRAHVVYIPRGVAHGCKALSNPAEIVYCVNQRFSPDPKTCDEYRLPSSIFGEKFWEYSPS